MIILSIILGGAGLGAALIDLGVPAHELNLAYVNGNPFAAKRDAIQSVLTPLFSSVAGVALLMRLGVEIAGPRLEQRLHGAGFYIVFSVCAAIVVVGMVQALAFGGNCYARDKWWTGCGETLRQAEYVVDHDGWKPGQRAGRSSAADQAEAERVRTENLDEAARRLSILEKLLELPSDRDLRSRIERLRPFCAAPVLPAIPD